MIPKIQQQGYGVRDKFKPYGLIEPENDYIFDLGPDSKDLENLYGKNLDTDEKRVAQDELAMINSRCENPTNPENHLPKGLFQPNGEYDKNKNTFIISVTSDPVWDLDDLLKALDAYFKMDNTEVRKITDQFNVIVAWSATMMDTYKTLQLVKQELGDKFNEAKSLFISGRRLHHGSADYFTDQPNISYPDSDNVAQNMFGATESGKKEKKYRFIQSSAISARGPGSEFGEDSFIKKWKSDLVESINTLCGNRSFTNANATMGKLKDGLNMDSINLDKFTLEDIAGIHVPVQAAARSLGIIEQ